MPLGRAMTLNSSPWIRQCSRYTNYAPMESRSLNIGKNIDFGISSCAIAEEVASSAEEVAMAQPQTWNIMLNIMFHMLNF